jgi:hypothetical protein
MSCGTCICGVSDDGGTSASHSQLLQVRDSLPLSHGAVDAATAQHVNWTGFCYSKRLIHRKLIFVTVISGPGIGRDASDHLNPVEVLLSADVMQGGEDAVDAVRYWCKDGEPLRRFVSCAYNAYREKLSCCAYDCRYANTCAWLH